MRKIESPQIQIGEVAISQIRFDLRSRDEIPKLLMGLQHLYCTPELRSRVFRILRGIVPKEIDRDNGRPGLDLWKILVLGTLRLCCNFDFDKLQEIANQHKTLREMLGHGILDKDYSYALQTLKDNVSMLTPEVLDRINKVVVDGGHQSLSKKKDAEELKGRCDSFVVETNVHFPTDINLLFDATRKIITLLAFACEVVGVSYWRQYLLNIKKVKKSYNAVRQLKHSNSKDDNKKEKREKLIIENHQSYLDLVGAYLDKAISTIETLRAMGMSESKIREIEEYIEDAERQIAQVRRRVMEDEKIPHSEKLFSLFEKHTEWICKGKAGVSQELGLKVCILEDQYGFILHHQVMQKKTDDQVAVSMVKETKKRFPEFTFCSFDKGFWSPANKVKLYNLLDEMVLPYKGKLSLADREIEHSEKFIQGRRQHSAVESAINALENHGLDRCPDHGLAGFKRYVSLAVVARNIQILGNIVQEKEMKRINRSEQLRQREQWWQVSPAT